MTGKKEYKTNMIQDGSILVHNCKGKDYPQIKIWRNSEMMWYIAVGVDGIISDFMIKYCPFCGMDLQKVEWNDLV